MKYLKILRIGVVLGVIMLNSVVIFAQDRGRISGTIVDKFTQKALSNVSVNIEGTSIGSVSDSNGIYRITAVPLKSYNRRNKKQPRWKF